MTLAQWIEKQGRTQRWFAGEVGAPEATVSRWCSGKMMPRLDRLRQIEQITGGSVTANDFAAGLGAAPSDERAA
jgi:transcriptional regulator with XRE-family HTH domain